MRRQADHLPNRGKGRRRPAAFVLALLFAALLQGPAWGRSVRQIVLLPTVNLTDFQVWESKYYPFDVLGRRMTDRLAATLRQDPFTDVLVLDEARTWFADPRRPGDMAVQMELSSVLSKEREALGTWEQGHVVLRVRLYDGASGEMVSSAMASGQDRRYTFDPGDDRLFFWVARDFPLFDILHKDGLDLLRLTPGDRGEKMSRLTWRQFSTTSTWQSFMNAIAKAADRIADLESGDFLLIGRILAPKADATPKRRTYIVSLGRRDSLAAGDILQVTRSDTYVTADPENAVVLLPKVVGNVKVLETFESESIVLLVNEKKEDPVALNDLVTAPLYGPRKAVSLR
ncbi:hypothetical protein KAR29_02295 [Aminithiophilus ramosus]|uniref:Flagellar assembly protein T C-terminal domain-containing protein n=1 Tax=Aminithiophilus ramosus TaxID=3029084 RepID=A0A9Q7EWF9_9BACT|nr:hypothetical protein [Aminithiophilus ramosus]QTX32784.1 hypothetical protein KAR29_02295 [Aminithiophilus ramosus]